MGQSPWVSNHLLMENYISVIWPLYGGVIAEKLGRMYGLQIYYYEDYQNVGISIAGREPKYHHNIQKISIM